MLLIYSICIVLVLILPFLVARHQGTRTLDYLHSDVWNFVFKHGGIIYYFLTFVFMLTQLFVMSLVEMVCADVAVYLIGLLFCYERWTFYHGDYLDKLAYTFMVSLGGILMGICFILICIYVMTKAGIM